MEKYHFTKFLIPFLTFFLLLTIDGFIISRMKEPYIYENNNDFKIQSFTAKDINGNTVTEKIFAQKFTVVCLWVTKDSENSQKLMAHIESLKTSTSADFQIVGIIGDLRETQPEINMSIANKLPNIVQIIPNDELKDVLIKIRNAPTVFFVDGEGKIIGQPVVGNEPILIEKELRRLIDKNFEHENMMRKAHKNIFWDF